jgi:Zn-dependent peptidase ImmA (M78 family)/transcriptional regulator with XRE-family HTH domain
MAEFTTALQGGVAAKLKEARRGSALSTREVVSRLLGTASISHATLANYESGKSRPTLAVIAALAELYGRPINWFLEHGPVLTGIRYRNLSSKVREFEKHRFEADALRWLEAYVKIEKLLETKPMARFIPAHQSRYTTLPELAQLVRSQLKIDSDAPVPSVIDALEAFGVRVIELSTTMNIDGLAAMFGDQPIVVLNPSRSDDRIRLNAAHEFFHLLLGHCDHERIEDKTDEDSAFACARHFILPDHQLKDAFEGKSFVKLVKFKEKFGISIAAMIYAAAKGGIISESESRFLWIQMSKRGWREKEPGTVRADRATRFEQLVDTAIGERKLTMRTVAGAIGVSEHELRDRIRLAQGLIQEEFEPKPPLGQEGDDPDFNGLRLAK